MGFLESIIRRGVSNAIGDVLGNKLDIGAQSTAQSYTTGTVGNMKEYFADILASEFSEYEIRRDVSATDFGTSTYNRPPKEFTFAMYCNGQIKAVVMLIPHGKGKNYPYLGAKQICDNAGIRYITFYEHFPNERSYVIDRIKLFL